MGTNDSENPVLNLTNLVNMSLAPFNQPVPRYSRVELIGFAGLEVGAIDKGDGTLTLVVRKASGVQKPDDIGYYWPQGSIPAPESVCILHSNMTVYVVSCDAFGPSMGIGCRTGILAGVDIVIPKDVDKR